MIEAGTRWPRYGTNEMSSIANWNARVAAPAGVDGGRNSIAVIACESTGKPVPALPKSARTKSAQKKRHSVQLPFGGTTQIACGLLKHRSTTVGDVLVLQMGNSASVRTSTAATSSESAVVAEFEAKN
jgi:hypothetical protein